MLAVLAEQAPLDDPRLVYEPKYDGIRALVEIDPLSPQSPALSARGAPPFDAVRPEPVEGRTVAQTKPPLAAASRVRARPRAQALLSTDRRRAPQHTGTFAPQHPSTPAPQHLVRVWSRLGNEKTAQFPEIVHELQRFGAKLEAPVLLDGEIVALDDAGAPIGFGHLQSRIHLTGRKDIAQGAIDQPVAFIAFDLLREAEEDLRPLPLVERRGRLERLLGRFRSPVVRLGECAVGNAARLLDVIEKQRLEGLLVKEAKSPYEAGRRSPTWRKLKIIRQQEFVVGGWTEPRGSRRHFGALLLGLYAPLSPQSASLSARGAPSLLAAASRVRARQRPQALLSPDRALIYVGSVGTGFDDRELAHLSGILKTLETDVCPFDQVPKVLERAHWVRPELVAQVKFAEWTLDGMLRAPVYLGLRDDVRPQDVRREAGAHPTRAGSARLQAGHLGPEPSVLVPDRDRAKPTRIRSGGASYLSPQSSALVTDRARHQPQALLSTDLARLVSRLEDLEDRGKDGILELPDGHTLKVTNLRKIFWPKLRITKGELMRYYLRVAPCLLPAVEDRPLVMKRFPNGIEGEAFYQQRAPDDVPPGVRVELVSDEGAPIGRGAGDEVLPRLAGGSLTTLVYMVQLAAISQDPWFSRARSPLDADYVALDLDPQPGVGFPQVLDVARWIGEELDRLGTPAVPKTSGSRGLHIYIPLRPGTSYESGMLFCQIVATIVATKHPNAATVERTVSARGKTVYVDYLQNIAGKTLATAYSARASEYAGVSAPLSWKEVDEGVDPGDFTIRTFPDRLRTVGDLWARLRTAKPADLRAVLKKSARLLR